MLTAVEHLTKGALGDKTLTYRTSDTAERMVRSGLTDTIDALSKRIARAAEGSVRLMADFRSKYFLGINMHGDARQRRARSCIECVMICLRSQLE